MESVKIVAKNNGYVVELDHDTHREYVFKSVEILEMIAFIGRHILGRKIKVTEN